MRQKEWYLVPMRKAEAIYVFLVAVSFLISAGAYDALPDQVVTHWGAGGEPDGYAAKMTALGIVPGVLVFYGIMFAAIPRAAAKKEHFHKFASVFERFAVVCMIFMLAIHVFIVAWGLGYRPDIKVVMALLMGPLYYSIGRMIEDLDPEWSGKKKQKWGQLGDKATIRFQRRMGKGFKLAGIAMGLSALAPEHLFWVLIAANILVFLWMFVALGMAYTEKDQ